MSKPKICLHQKTFPGAALGEEDEGCPEEEHVKNEFIQIHA
jgi:hypothetical protein